MRSFAGIAVGVLIGLVTAIYPFYYVNLLFCAGLIAGGYVAVRVAGSRTGQIESVQGFRIGLMVGMGVALVTFLLNWVLQGGVSLPLGGNAGARPLGLLDAMPPVFTNFVERFFAGFRNLISGGFSTQLPGVTLGERFFYNMILLPFFSSIGGIMGASMYRRQPPVAPNRVQEVPVSPY